MKNPAFILAASIGFGALGCGDGVVSTEPALDPVEGVAAFAVVSSAFGESASITLLDANGEVLALNWLNSGSTYPGQVAALSTDVALPTGQMNDGSVTVLDRFGFDVVSRFDVSTGGVFGQLRTDDDNRDPNVEFLAFGSNPSDVAFVDARSAWVSRNNPNGAGGAPTEEQGSDLIEIDPRMMERTDGRIDFSLLNQESNGQTIFARPSRIVRRGGYLLVGLALLSAGFDIAGTGMLAIVDLGDLSLSTVPIPELTNCGAAQPVPRSESALVTCDGDPNFVTFVNDPNTVGHALISFDSTTGTASVASTWVQGADEGRQALTRNAVAIGGTEIVAAASSADGSQMIYSLLDVATGTATEFLNAEPAFGTSAFGAENDLVLIPGGSAGVHRFDASGDVLVDLGDIAIDANGLPVVAVYAL